jgi:hypothetical protein
MKRRRARAKSMAGGSRRGDRELSRVPWGGPCSSLGLRALGRVRAVAVVLKRVAQAEADFAAHCAPVALGDFTESLSFSLGQADAYYCGHDGSPPVVSNTVVSLLHGVVRVQAACYLNPSELTCCYLNPSGILATP